MSEKLLKFLLEGKLLVALLSQVAAFALVWNSKIPPDIYLTIAVAIPVAFITGSVLDSKISSVTFSQEK